MYAVSSPRKRGPRAGNAVLDQGGPRLRGDDIIFAQQLRALKALQKQNQPTLNAHHGAE